VDQSEIPGTSATSAVSVTTLTRTAKDVLEGAFLPLWVRGEVSDFKAHRNGHWYFNLRDAESQLRCVVWSRDQRRMPAAPDDGMQVSALGQMTIYTGRGDLQFGVKALEAEGDGLHRKALEASFARLEADGLFAPGRKRRIPRFPRRIALITSPDGAALHDVLAVVRRRCPTVEVVVIGTRVQGEGAPAEICAALERVSRWADADVAIIGRGGGSRDDLWAFNDEAVARAVAACPIPVISAVGHEVDFTLCDLVADLRAATPSAAAEAAVPVLAEEQLHLQSLAAALRGGVERRLGAARADVASGVAMLAAAAHARVGRARSSLESLTGRLNALSPLAVLSRGYAVAQDAEGRTLRRRQEFAPGDVFTLRVHDGVVDARVESVRR